MDKYVRIKEGGGVFNEKTYSDKSVADDDEYFREDNRKTLPTTVDELTIAKENHVFRDVDREECYSDEDKEFLELFPDTSDPNYMELTIKQHMEHKRR